MYNELSYATTTYAHKKINNKFYQLKKKTLKIDLCKTQLKKETNKKFITSRLVLVHDVFY